MYIFINLSSSFEKRTSNVTYTKEDRQNKMEEVQKNQCIPDHNLRDAICLYNLLAQTNFRTFNFCEKARANNRKKSIAHGFNMWNTHIAPYITCLYILCMKAGIITKLKRSHYTH